MLRAGDWELRDAQLEPPAYGGTQPGWDFAVRNPTHVKNGGASDLRAGWKWPEGPGRDARAPRSAGLRPDPKLIRSLNRCDTIGVRWGRADVGGWTVTGAETLANSDYPPDLEEKAVDLVLEQSEPFAGDAIEAAPGADGAAR